MLSRNSVPVIVHDENHEAVSTAANKLNCSITPQLVEDGYSFYVKNIETDQMDPTNLVASSGNTWNILNTNSEPIYLSKIFITLLNTTTYFQSGWGSSASALNNGLTLSYSDRNGVLTTLSPGAIRDMMDIMQMDPILTDGIVFNLFFWLGASKFILVSRPFDYLPKIEPGDVLLQSDFGVDDFTSGGSMTRMEIRVEYYAKSELV